MKRVLFAGLVCLFMTQISAYGQLKASSAHLPHLPEADVLISPPKDETARDDNLVLAARAIAALKRLDNEVLVYRSLGDFEANGRLARVTFGVFKHDLQQATAEVEPLLSRLPQNKFKVE